MFIEKRVKRVRDALVHALKSKSMAIAVAHKGKKPEDIPWTDTARCLLLADIADIILNLQIDERPEDKT